MALSEQTVLIVDDDRTNRMILAGVLKDECHVMLAKDGASALRMAQENEDIHLILLDITMPDMDGHEVLRSLKEDPRTSDIPVVFITGNTEEKEEEYGLVLGAADYVFKPVRPAIVRARIRNLLKVALLGRELTRDARRDAATGLFTRAYFEEALTTMCALAGSAREPLGLAIVEIDISQGAADRNDALLLRKVARCIERHASRPFDVAARYGEASFAILFPRASEIRGTLEEIRSEIQDLGPTLVSGVRIGAIATLGTDGGIAADGLLAKAQAMLAEVGSENGDSLALAMLDSQPPSDREPIG